MSDQFEVTPVATAAGLIADDMRRAMQMIEESEPTVCVGGNQHVVSPQEWARAATAICACCGKWIVVKL